MSPALLLTSTARATGDDDRRQGGASDRDGPVQRGDVAADGRARAGLRHLVRREAPFVAAALEHVLPRSRRVRVYAGQSEFSRGTH